MVPGRRETAQLASWGAFVSMGGGITTLGADDKAPPIPLSQSTLDSVFFYNKMSINL